MDNVGGIELVREGGGEVVSGVREEMGCEE